MAKKRANGEGNIRKRKDGHWEGRYTAGYNAAMEYARLKKMLLDYAKKNGIRSGAIFITRNGKPLDRSNIWAQMKSLCEAAGVKASKMFPHNLRKLFARTFYGIEKKIAKLADIL